MQRLKTIVLAGVAALAFAGVSALAANRIEQHTMTVALPDGGVAHIEYSGNVAPKVRFESPTRIDFPFWGFADPFPALDQASARMEQEMQAMLRSNGLDEAALKSLPAGGSTYSMISTWSANGACVKSVEITRTAGDAKPKVVSRSSGSCDGSAASGAPVPDAQATSISYR